MNTEDFLTAADTSRVQGGGRSIVDKMYDAATAGTAGAVVSGLSSIYNTGVAVANVFGAEAERIDTARVLGDVNANWRQYYEENAQVIDTVGFIGGAFIPGGIALKGLQAVRAGKSFGTFGSVLRYTQEAQEAALAKGLKEIGTEGGTLFARMNANKLTSMAWGVADNAIQTAVFETAAAAAMHASPLFANESFGDIVWDITKTSIFGGVLGGGVEALFTNRIFRDAGKLVDRGQRKFDAVVQLDKMGLNVGDETFNLIDELFTLPKEVLAGERVVKYNYKLNGKDLSTDIEVGGLYDKKLSETSHKVLQTIQSKLTNIVAGDVTVGKPVAMAMLDIIQDGAQRNVGDDVTRQALGNYLFGLKKIEGMGAAPVDFSKEVIYMTPGGTIQKGENPVALFSSKKVTDKDQGYRIIGNIADAKLGVVGIDGATIKDVHKAGFDGAIGPNGSIKLNPDSSIFRPVAKEVEDSNMRMLFNTRSKTMADSAMPTVADIATVGKDLRVTNTGVISGDRTFEFNLGNFDPTADTVKNTARHLWATKVDKIDNTVINSADFSLLDRMVAFPSVIGKDVRIGFPDGTTKTVEELGPLAQWVVNRKLEVSVDSWNAAKKAGDSLDPRELAYRINAEHEWVERAIALEFDNTRMISEKSTRPLDSYAARENIVMVYDQKIKEAIKDGDFVTAQQNYEYRKTIAVQKTQEAAAAVLRDDFSRLIDLNADALAGKFDATGVGATGLGFSNANYGDIGRLWAQDVGKTVSLIAQKRVNSALARIQPAAAEIITNPLDGAELAAVLTKVRRSEDSLSLMDGRLVDLASKKKMIAALAIGDAKAASEISFSTNIKLSDRVTGFLEAHHELHQRQLADRVTLANAQGTVLHWDADALYLPPIDTRKVPFFAFVREVEGKAFGTSEVAMITARNPEELQRLTSAVGKEYQVIFKADTEAYHKAAGDYEYTRALNQPTLDPFLRKQGKLGDFLPSLDAKGVVEDFVVHHTRKEQQLTRDATEVRYAQTFSELRWLSEQNTKVEKSKFAFLGSMSQKAITDPFGDYVKTALNISKRTEFTLWHQANEFVDALGTRAYQATEKAFQDAQGGKISWSEGNALMERMGLGSPFKDHESFLTAQVGNDRNFIKEAINKGNMLLSTVGLRLDVANSLLNIISTPIMLGTEVASIRRAMKSDPEMAGKFAEMTSVVDPLTGVAVPSTSKMVLNAIKNYWSPAGKEMVNGRYKEIGAIKDIMSMHHEMMADLSLVPNMVPKKWATNVEKWTEKASTFTGNNFAEQFTRFVAADVMRQMTDPLVAAGRMGVKEQDAYISVFVNRVQGNYTASQRPILFQGTIGAAIGLFQTYQFNMFQQLFRHIENRDGRTVAVMAGLQTSIFGMNGLPMFEAINTHLIGQASMNEQHHDVYSFAVKATDKKIADWALYGSASAFPIFTEKMPALYTRGDLNPRHVTIVPTSFAQVPVVEASSRIVGNLLGMAKQLSNGDTVAGTLLFGLEHNGVSRPLAGIAQSVQGFATTGKGSLISSASDFNAIATASRILGAKPMDEAVALNTKFRLEGYKAADRARLEDLGIAVKQRIRDGSLDAEAVNELQGRYAAVGGRVDTFGAALQRWQRGATQSVVNTLADSQKTAYGQRMNEIMGADRLEDSKYPGTQEP